MVGNILAKKYSVWIVAEKFGLGAVCRPIWSFGKASLSGDEEKNFTNRLCALKFNLKCGGQKFGRSTHLFVHLGDLAYRDDSLEFKINTVCIENAYSVPSPAFLMISLKRLNLD